MISFDRNCLNYYELVNLNLLNISILSFPKNKLKPKNYQLFFIK